MGLALSQAQNLMNLIGFGSGLRPGPKLNKFNTFIKLGAWPKARPQHLMNLINLINLINLSLGIALGQAKQIVNLMLCNEQNLNL